MRGTVIAVTFDVFIVKIEEGLYSIIELPSSPNENERSTCSRLLDIYKESDVDVFNEVQGNLLTEGSAEIRNLSKDKIFNAKIIKAPATARDLTDVL